MKRLASVPGLMALVLPALAFAAPPEGTDWNALLIETIEANDCVMTEADADDILPGLGFEKDWIATVVFELMEAGQAEFRDGDGALIVKTEKCQ
ncbi:hypothetical protein [Pseudogemmobacter faecipullorum]|uniref:Uncharacterized protein n=1 Tax=Pseudogemmobacter faecipullorum TaxID=2755041 RepID=A0ABS8CKB8_9RHOB|nr:hypothetical protein [Pseudogemmobacter faecipullorum]MCB5409838.1 hypothetical protein [Pseudogemmobacter faecipullorum]